MADARSFILAPEEDDATRQQAVQSITSRLVSKSATLVDTVASLREYMVEDDPQIRARAMRFLSQIVAALPPAFLSLQQANVLCGFFCDRIEDSVSLSAISQLCSTRKFTDEMALMTFKAMVDNLNNLQFQPHGIRFAAISLLHSLMSKHRSVIKGLGSESVSGILSLVQGEKDPRILMMVFSILRAVISEWDIVDQLNVLFDSVFCYFPIVFRQPKDSPSSITVQDLKTRLRECITSSSHFAPLAFTQLLDKLDSTSANVKKDVLQTLSACTSSYSVTVVMEYSTVLWDSLKFEIFNAHADELAEEALTTIKSIATRLQDAEIVGHVDRSKPLTPFISQILQECNDRLQEPLQKHAKPANRIIEALLQSSPYCLGLVVLTIMPQLLSSYDNASTGEERAAILGSLLLILEYASSFSLQETNIPSASGAQIFFPYKDDIFQRMSRVTALENDSEATLQGAASHCLVLMCCIRELLDIVQVRQVIGLLSATVTELGTAPRSKKREHAIIGLQRISKSRPDLIIDHALPIILASLHHIASDSILEYKPVLEALGRIGSEKEVCCTVTRRLLGRIGDALSTALSTHFVRSVISTLCYILERTADSPSELLQIMHKNVRMLAQRTGTTAIEQSSLAAFIEEDTIVSLGELAFQVLCRADHEQQEDFRDNLYQLFCDEPIYITRKPQSEISLYRRRTIILSAYLLAGIGRQPYTSPKNDAASIYFNDLIPKTLTETSATIRFYLCQHLGLLVNKCMDIKTLDTVLLVIRTLSSQAKETMIDSHHHVELAFYLSKALLLRSYRSEEILSLLTGMLESSCCGSVAAKAFGILSSKDDLISKANAVNIRLLARQKMLLTIITKVVGNFQHTDVKFRSNHLFALSYSLRNAPIEFFRYEAEHILPLLLQSMDLGSIEVKTLAMDILIELYNDRPEALKGHLSGLINRLIRQLKISLGSDTTVRHTSLTCLKQLPNVSGTTDLMPFRSAVIRSLLFALDDPKRDVRKAAVECQVIWHNLDQPNVDD